MENATPLQINGGYKLHTFEEVEELYSNYISSAQDKQRIKSAYSFIIEKHKGQVRKSGEPYYHHLIEVAYILSELNAGPDTIIAGLLHDVVEDTDVTVEEISDNWGEDVAKLVDALTKIQRLKLSKIEASEFEAEDHRKILIGMSRDIRVIIIKLADRLHNIRTLAALSPERQKTLARETMDVFVPIAHRLGIDSVKTELEDLCLKYLEPEKYDEIVKLLSKKSKKMAKSLEILKKKIADILFVNNINFEISSRVKSIYSIYRKMYNKGRLFDEIYDILALRIICKTEIECYEILGLIHQTYKPVPGRFKDYIAMPKNNMYQSLHTTVVGGDGNFYEVQIRTEEMNQVAESGVAAHWAYKEGNGYNSQKEQQEIENKLHWFRDFVSITNESENDNASEYIDNLTHDIFEAKTFVFTPKGKVIELPAGSTPVDFAYRIHTKIGDSTVGAVVNGTLVPLNTVLKSGDFVEIKTSKNSNGPSEGWLDFVKSNSAKTQIRKFLAKRDSEMLKEEKINKGKTSLIDAFNDRGYSEESMLEYVNNQKLFEYYGCDSLDDLFIAVSNRKPTANAVIEFLNIKKKIVIPTEKKTSKSISNDNCPVYCKGVGRIAISLANCCTPIPGDEIVGYVTQGKGITVHRKNCPNIQNEKERLVEVFWKEDLKFQTYPVDILIECSDRPNLLIDIMHTLSNIKITVDAIHAKSNKANLTATFTATLLIASAKKLSEAFAIIKSINGVYAVSRIIH